MKTTLNLNGEILKASRSRAVQDGLTLTRFVEDALRAKLMDEARPRPPFRLEVSTVTGTRPPSVDISDRDALYEVMDGDDRS